MCIIAIKPSKKKMFDEATIRQMFRRNPDGAGIMFPRDNGKVYIRKGFMNVESLLEYINKYDWANTPVILHFRIGTAGSNNELNCHPYPIRHKNFTRGYCDLAMAHNGVMHGYNPTVADGDINDSQKFVNTVLNKLPIGFHNNKAIMRLIEDAVSPSRLAFMDGNGRIKIVGNWVEDNGYLFSNESYKIPKVKPVTYSYPYSYCPSYKPISYNKPKKKKDEFTEDPLTKEQFLKLFEKDNEVNFLSLIDFYEAMEFLETEGLVLEDGCNWEYAGYEYYSPTGTTTIYRVAIDDFGDECRMSI